MSKGSEVESGCISLGELLPKHRVKGEKGTGVEIKVQSWRTL